MSKTIIPIYQNYTCEDGTLGFYQQNIYDSDPVPEGWTTNLAEVQPPSEPTSAQKQIATLSAQLMQAQSAIQALTAAQLTSGGTE